jgi:hypothetical protein
MHRTGLANNNNNNGASSLEHGLSARSPAQANRITINNGHELIFKTRCPGTGTRIEALDICSSSNQSGDRSAKQKEGREHHPAIMESSLNLLTSRQKDELIQFPAAVSHYRCGSGCNGLKCCHPERGGWREMGRVISGRFSRLIAGLQGHRGNKRRRFQYYKGPLAFCIIHTYT